jgi:Predicted esterase of the alpha-beta hydrolase superfamily
MVKNIRNLIFSGGGILGVSYLGALDYLYSNNLLEQLTRTAGTSAGAIAACITSFHLPFENVLEIANSLDYRKVPDKSDVAIPLPNSEELLQSFEAIFGDISCLYRLITEYGWFSSGYFYHWLQGVIKNQFNHIKKPPYTFLDFRNPLLHNNNRVFHDLYIVGSNLTTGTTQVFSYETTPLMEVAQAVRISMSVPLFFEAVRLEQPEIAGNQMTNIFCDGGLMNNYPLPLFDSPRYGGNMLRGANMESLGIRFQNNTQPHKIDNLLDYIIQIALTSGYVQQEAYQQEPMNRIRSISIDSGDVPAFDFNLTAGDNTYQLLYQQGYAAAMNYFTAN